MRELPDSPYDLAEENGYAGYLSEEVKFYKATAYWAFTDEIVWESEIYSDGWTEDNYKFAKADGWHYLQSHPDLYLEVEVVGHEWRANGPDPLDYPED